MFYFFKNALKVSMVTNVIINVSANMAVYVIILVGNVNA